VLEDGPYPAPTFTAGAEHSTETADGVAWEIRDDVLRRVTSARTHTVSDYETPYDGHGREDYRGEVSVDRRTFEQRAHAETVLDLTWPGIAVQARSVMDVTVTTEGVDVAIETWMDHDGTEISHRAWRERIPPPY